MLDTLEVLWPKQKTFLELSQKDEPFFCGVCLLDIFPFTNISDNNLAKEFVIKGSAKSVSKLKNCIAEYGKLCSVCRKSIRTPASSIPCCQCKHLIHKNAPN